MAAKKLAIVLARVDTDFEVVSDRGRDLGRRPEMREIPKPVAMMWLNKGTESDVEKARKHAVSEGYDVFVYDATERDPLGRAKRDILRGKSRSNPSSSSTVFKLVASDGTKAVGGDWYETKAGALKAAAKWTHELKNTPAAVVFIEEREKSRHLHVANILHWQARYDRPLPLSNPRRSRR